MTNEFFPSIAPLPKSGDVWTFQIRCPLSRWFTRCNSQNLWSVFRDAQYEGCRPHRRDLPESVFL